MREINSTIDESTARSTGDTLAPNQLFTRCSNSLKEKWSSAELKDLVEFVLFHCTGELWPSHKQMGFWETASTFVASRSDSIAYRSGNFNIFYNVTTNHSLLAASACRSQVVGCLKKQYKTSKGAEKVFFKTYRLQLLRILKLALSNLRKSAVLAIAILVLRVTHVHFSACLVSFQQMSNWLFY